MDCTRLPVLRPLPEEEDDPNGPFALRCLPDDLLGAFLVVGKLARLAAIADFAALAPDDTNVSFGCSICCKIEMIRSSPAWWASLPGLRMRGRNVSSRGVREYVDTTKRCPRVPVNSGFKNSHHLLSQELNQLVPEKMHQCTWGFDVN